MKKYSIAIILVLSLFIEIFFELQFPFLTILLGMALCFLAYYSNHAQSTKKMPKSILSTLYYIAKYISALWLIFVYVVFMDYTINHFQLVHYSILTILFLTLIGLDIWEVFKWYRSKTNVNPV